MEGSVLHEILHISHDYSDAELAAKLGVVLPKSAKGQITDTSGISKKLGKDCF
jgi:hypothetical protein